MSGQTQTGRRVAILKPDRDAIAIGARPLVVAGMDRDAVAIGRLWRKTNATAIECAQNYLRIGRMLLAKKEKLNHGEWLPWLTANADALGFEARMTASKLMRAAAKCNSTVTFEDAPSAAAFTRMLWGHADSRLIQQSVSNEHYTPEQYLEAARKVLGRIDLDPASNVTANRLVKAEMFFSAEDNGLEKVWSGRVWLNPPYGGLAGDFVAKFMQEYRAKRITAGILLVNAHCTDTDWFQPLLDGMLCFTDHRINFYGDDARSGSTHGSVFVYFGENEAKFAELFSEFGAVLSKWGRAPPANKVSEAAE